MTSSDPGPFSFSESSLLTFFIAVSINSVEPPIVRGNASLQVRIW